MPIRVLIVDDSAIVRGILRQALAGEADIEVVGEAGDGLRALKLVSELSPDVITMDMLMPLMSGMDAIRRIMTSRPTPILVVADAHGDEHGLAMEALGAGATEVLTKPRGGFDERAASDLCAGVRRVAAARVARTDTPTPVPNVRSGPRREADIVGIVGSTGAPQVIRSILGALSPSFPWPIAVVQHTARGFTKPFADWLDSGTVLKVRVAENGRRFTAGDVLVAPDDFHLEVRGGIASLLETDPVDGHCPSATVLLRSLAAAYGSRAIGIVLTGMGRDGADGAGDLGRAGGLVIVEDPVSAALPGMPGEALRQVPGALREVAPSMGELLAELAGGRRS